jgi:hypothetical protein
MCARRCGWDFHIRKWAAFFVASLLEWRHGVEAAGFWLWNETPWPAALPMWGQIWAGIKTAAARKARS